MMQQTPAPGPTVGDTVWVSRSVAAPDGYAVRPGAWNLTGSVELLGQPTVERAGDSVMVRYPLVAWDPGQHVVQMPGPILIAPSGAEDTLPARAVTIAVRSVLPSGVPDSALQIQPLAGAIVRGQASPWPLAALLVLATLLVAALRWWWGRSGKPRAMPDAVQPAPQVSLESWHLAGEDRAVVAFATRDLRDGIRDGCPAALAELPTDQLLAILEHERPQWPLSDLARLLGELDLARFSAGHADAVALAGRAAELRRRLAEAAR